MSFLEEILASTRAEVDQRIARVSLRELAASVPQRADDRRFLRALQAPGMSIIAEFKRSSPAKGQIVEAPVLAEFVSAYERGGASALSILTEPNRFHGSLEDLEEAREISRLPILRKDFIIDRYQVFEAAKAGADAILLIVAAFKGDHDTLRLLHDEARGLGLDVLIEVRNEEELEAALAIDQDLVGVNNRDLDTFNIDSGRTGRLAAKAGGAIVVGESGIETADGLADLARHGVAAALIGTALMRASSPETLCRELSSVPVPRAARRTAVAA